MTFYPGQYNGEWTQQQKAGGQGTLNDLRSMMNNPASFLSNYGTSYTSQYSNPELRNLLGSVGDTDIQNYYTSLASGAPQGLTSAGLQMYYSLPKSQDFQQWMAGLKVQNPSQYASFATDAYNPAYGDTVPAATNPNTIPGDVLQDGTQLYMSTIPNLNTNALAPAANTNTGTSTPMQGGINALITKGGSYQNQPTLGGTNNTTWGGTSGNPLSAWSTPITGGTGLTTGGIQGYNPTTITNTGGNPFMSSSGSFQYPTAGMWNYANQQIAPSMGTGLATSNALLSTLGPQLMNDYPAGMSSFLQNLIGQQGGMGSSLMNSQGNAINTLQPYLNSSIANLLTGSTPQNANAASTLLGGNGTYGVSDLLSSIMQGGLPNQLLIQALANPQVAYGQGQQGAAANTASQLAGGNVPQTGLQTQTGNVLSGLINGSGLSPELVSAMRASVLDPSQQALQARLNRQGGGVSSPYGGLEQELLRRNEADFNNQMIQAGYGNLSNFLNQAQNAGAQGFGQGLNLAQLQSGMGQQGIGNAMNAFQTVAQSAYPYVNQAGNMVGNLGNLNLQNLSTASGLAYNPLLVGSQMTNSAAGQGGNLLQSMLSGLLGFQGNANQYGLGMTNQYTDLAKYLLQSQLQNKALNQGQGTDWGTVAAAGGDLAGSILDAIFGGESGGGPNSYPSSEIGHWYNYGGFWPDPNYNYGPLYP